MAKRKNGDGSWGTKAVNGKTYKRFRSPEGKDFYGKSEKEVKQKYLNWKNDLENSNIKRDNVTIVEVARSWLKSIKKQVKASTYDGYEYFVDGILKKKNGYDLGNMQIQQVKKEQVQNYIDYLADNIAKSSIKKDKALLHQVFDFAIENGIITNNVVQSVKIPIDDNIKVASKPHIFISTDDRKKLELEEIKQYKNGKRYYGNNAKIIVFLMHTGLRFGELTALRWKNVDFRNKTMLIVDNSPIVVNRDKNAKTKYKLDNTSTKRKSSERIVPLSNKSIEILQYFYDKYSHNDIDYVFVSDNNTPANRRNVHRCLLGMLKNAKCAIVEASPHDLRHSFGSELIKNGVDVKVVSELMGHKDIQTTYNIYIHVLESQKSDAINVFNS